MTYDDAQVAFVLGGGGVLGASEVGMLRALLEADVRPDVVLGASIGAINGAMIAAESVDGEHFMDGGLVNSIPVGRAIEMDARTVYVFQVGRIETPLTAPRRP